MSRPNKDQQDETVQPKSASGPGEGEEDDGYVAPKWKRNEPPKPAPAAAPTKQLSTYEAFMEQHWEGWLRPVLILAIMAVGYVTYNAHILPESTAGMLAAGAVVVAAIYSTAMPAIEMIQSKNRRTLFGLVVLIWAFSSGYPTLRKAVPKPILGEAVLTDANKSVKVPLNVTGTGPFDLTVTGKLRASGTQLATANYEVTVTGSEGGSATVEDSLEYSVHQTRVRKGTNQWTESHDEIVHRLPTEVKGHELTLTTDKVDDLLENGLHLQVHPQSINPWIFWSLGLLVVLIMMGVEATVGDHKDKTHLVMASLATLAFAFRFHQHATSANLVRPAVEALFVAALVGGVGGTFLGWLVRKISGRDKLRPKPDRKRRAGEKDDEE